MPIHQHRVRLSHTIPSTNPWLSTQPNAVEQVVAATPTRLRITLPAPARDHRKNLSLSITTAKHTPGTRLPVPRTMTAGTINRHLQVSLFSGWLVSVLGSSRGRKRARSCRCGPRADTASPISHSWMDSLLSFLCEIIL